MTALHARDRESLESAHCLYIRLILIRKDIVVLYYRAFNFDGEYQQQCNYQAAFAGETS